MVERRPMGRDGIEQSMALIEKAQQLAGHFPDAEALDRARRILEGNTSPDEAWAELEAKYGFQHGGDAEATGVSPPPRDAHSPRSTRHHW